MWPRSSKLEPTEWHQTGGRRVLIEHHDSSIAVAVGNLLAAEGYDVSHCRGPADGGGKCPLVKTGVCERAAQADAVFCGLDITDESDREVLANLRRHFDETPVIVEMARSRIPLYAEELEGCVVIPQPMTRESVLRAVETALR